MYCESHGYHVTNRLEKAGFDVFLFNWMGLMFLSKLDDREAVGDLSFYLSIKDVPTGTW